MGQVISLPTQRKEAAPVITAERRAAFITGLSALTFLLGFFIAGPMLAIYAFGFATTAHPGSVDHLRCGPDRRLGDHARRVQAALVPRACGRAAARPRSGARGSSPGRGRP